MASVNLTNMDVDSLLALRGEIDGELEERSRDLRQQLARLEGTRRGPGRPAGKGPSTLKGIKVEPRFRGPNGETWAGRGARPKWLQALLDEGHSLDEFAIEAADGRADESKEEAKPARAKRGAAKKSGRRKAA
ncbi:regulator [Rhodoplanes elegans]|uniref:Regulator n=1 Tax=Rhodoplanes elegans TaxID=29408 RepID=A0A327KR66_9BRAD|nr:H-NS family nucleoid-associated regulatory protein [Rhodoplanes elegans]MBK5960398.1 regulator [Rhodoplanes elegans]RAI40767.1 regulator [Rhodoplanes elegans]